MIRLVKNYLSVLSGLESGSFILYYAANLTLQTSKKLINVTNALTGTVNYYIAVLILI
jgi:hypothetical protein